MIHWPKITVADLIETGEADLQTGPFGTQLKASDYVETGVPVINVRNIGYGDIRPDNLEYIEEKTVERLKVHILKKDDIVFGRKGAVDRYALVGEKTEGWVQGSDCLRLRIESKRVWNKYVSYYFATAGHKNWMEAMCSFGATMSSLNQDIVRRITIPLPEPSTQRKIAAILTAYDDLIETNQRRITLLERMAEAIYREWFVRLRFPGHETATFEKGVPVGWETSTLNKVTDITMGQSPKSEFYNEIGDGLPFHQGVGTYGSRFPKKAIYCNSDGRKAHRGDILFSVRAPVGRLNIADCEMIIGRGLAAISHKHKLNSYLYYCLKALFANEDIIGNGSIFNSVGKDELAGFGLLRPPQELAMKYDQIASNIDEQIALLTRASENILCSKGSLLSRLISGKLSVEDLDIQYPLSLLAETEAGLP